MYDSVSQKCVPLEFAKDFRMPLPPFEEKIIICFLSAETARMNEMLTQVESAIARFSEHHQALITSAVTGKIERRLV